MLAALVGAGCGAGPSGAPYAAPPSSGAAGALGGTAPAAALEGGAAGAPAGSTPAASLEGEGKGPTPDYVPADLDDAHRELLRMLSKEDVDLFRTKGEEGAIMAHHGLGMWLRNNWGLWKGSRLSSYFNGLGVVHPDDMSGIILESFVYKLQGRPFPLRERVAEFRAYWQSMKEPDGPSPKDGSPIKWSIIKGAGVGAVHLGTSRAGRDRWRYEYGSGRGIEPARLNEARELDAVAPRPGR